MASPWMMPGVLVALAIGGFYTGCHWEEGRWKAAVAKAELQVRGRDSMIARLRVDSASLSTQHHVDTVSLTVWRNRWRTIKETLHDTLPPDTVTVERIVQIADSTIGACTTALASCEDLRGNAENRALVAEKINKDLRVLLAKPKPLLTWDRAGLGLIAALFIYREVSR